MKSKVYIRGPGILYVNSDELVKTDKFKEQVKQIGALDITKRNKGTHMNSRNLTLDERTIVVVSGGFDPVHSGHIALFNYAKELGDKLIVAINSDDWLKRKKGKYFMPINERANILNHLQMVDMVLSFDDVDDTAIDALKKVKSMYKNATIIFANGGDRTSDNIPEMSLTGIEFVFGIGGVDKKNSSSKILETYENTDVAYYYGA